MLKKILFVLGIFTIAFVVLLISIFDSSAINYSVTKSPSQPSFENNTPNINYTLPYMGRVLPDSPFWGLKALRDKIWFGITTSHLRRAELALLFSDKRLLMSKKLFEEGKTDVAVSTFTKGEKYLAIAVSEEVLASKNGMDTGNFLNKLALAALKHKEVGEDLIQLAPEEAKPLIVKTKVYARDAYEAARNALNSKGLPVPKDPFDGD